MKNTTVKTNRISLGIKIACILACVALFSVGFAAWLILQPTVEQEKLGSFQVYAAQENNISITVTEGTGAKDAKINFGAPANYEAGPVDWLIFKDYIASGESATVEDLVAEFTIEYSSSINLDEAVSNLDIQFSVPESVINTFKDSHFVAAPKIEYNTTSATADTWTEASYDKNTGTANISVDAPESSTATVYVRVTFDWGDISYGENPITYFNALGANEDTILLKTAPQGENPAVYYTNREAAKLMFDAINDLADISYTLIVDAR